VSATRRLLRDRHVFTSSAFRATDELVPGFASGAVQPDKQIGRTAAIRTGTEGEVLSFEIGHMAGATVHTHRRFRRRVISQGGRNN
jgi:hypothetical protein